MKKIDFKRGDRVRYVGEGEAGSDGTVLGLAGDYGLGVDWDETTKRLEVVYVVHWDDDTEWLELGGYVDCELKMVRKKGSALLKRWKKVGKALAEVSDDFIDNARANQHDLSEDEYNRWLEGIAGAANVDIEEVRSYLEFAAND